MGANTRAIIFDCFGVIITDGLEAAIQQLEKTDDQARGFISGIIKQNNIGLIAPEESNRRIADYLGLPVAEWQKMVAVGEVKSTDVVEWIGELRQQYKTGLLSNIGRGSLQRRFTDQELSRLFDVVVISGDVGVIKPDPEIYRLTAEKLGVNLSECVFLDDRQSYVEAAVKAGMRGVYYQNYRQARVELEALLA